MDSFNKEKNKRFSVTALVSRGFFPDSWQRDAGRCRQLDQADVRMVEETVPFGDVGCASLSAHFASVANQWRDPHTNHVASHEDFNYKI